MADTRETTPGGVKRKRNFFDDEGLSDVIIKFGDKKFFAHKVILTRESVWFERAFLGGFSEAEKKIIELHDDDGPTAIMAMLRHVYGTDYEDQGRDEDNCYTIGFHLSVFMLGDKYDISSLRTAVESRFLGYLYEETDLSDLSDETIYTIQKLLGPNAPQLADKALIRNTSQFVLDNYEDLFYNTTFRGLLAEGAMLQKDLALKFLDRVKEAL